MLTSLFLEKIGATEQAADLFKISIRPSQEQMNQIRVLLEEFFWDNVVQFEEREFLGYYTCDTARRKVGGLWPVNYLELAFLFLYLSTLVFDTPDLDSSIRWMRQCGDYCRYLDNVEWGSACGLIEAFVQKALVSTVGSK